MSISTPEQNSEPRRISRSQLLNPLALLKEGSTVPPSKGKDATLADILVSLAQMSRRGVLVAGAAGAALAIASQFPSETEAAGFKQMLSDEVNSFYPGDPGTAKLYGMRMMTADDSGLASLDAISKRIAREYYGIEVAFDNLGWYKRFQIEHLTTYPNSKSSFGLCESRAAWAVRDEWPFRQPGEPMFDIPGLLAPSTREMAEMKIFGFAPFAFYFYSADERESLAFFTDRALSHPGEVSAGFMVDIPRGYGGEWWGDVAKVVKEGTSCRYLVCRAGQSYEWFDASEIRFSAEPVDDSDLSDFPKEKPGLKLRARSHEEYRSPYYFSPFVRSIYYREPLPPKKKFTDFLDRLR